MIHFPCISCSEPLAVPADLAGGDIQCPVCGTLCSIPLVSDLPNLNRDGTHLFAPVGTTLNAQALLWPLALED